MKITIAVMLIVSFWTAAMLQSVRAEQGATTWSGIYTEEQASRGQAAYKQHCAECHGADLNGDGYAPALKGPDFMTMWNGLGVGDLYERIRISMPPSNVNAASPQEKLDIVAHLLKAGGFPAGKTELPSELDALKSIKIEQTKPGR